MINGGISLSITRKDGVPEVSVVSQFEKPLTMNDDEKKVAKHFYSLVNGIFPDLAFKFENRSKDYITLSVGNIDFLRFKYTLRTKWLSIDVSGLNISEDDQRFSAQKKKSQRFWKAQVLNMEDMFSFDDLVMESCQFAVSLPFFENKSRA